MTKNSYFLVTSIFTNVPNLVYKVLRTFSDFSNLSDELGRIVPGNRVILYSSMPAHASALEVFIRKAASYDEIKTSTVFASFLSSEEFVTSASGNSPKRLKSMANPINIQTTAMVNRSNSEEFAKVSF